MKAAYINEICPANGIKYGDLAEPEFGEHEVLVRVHAVAVDPVDTYIRSGVYKVEMPFPFIVGRDMVGAVEQVGSHVLDFKRGDRVWANNQGYSGRQGTFAELLSIEESLLYHLPAAVDEHEAVAVLHSALTAVVGLFTKADIQSGESIFINGGAGNVGSAVLQLAQSTGARVAVTAGSKEKIEWCRRFGPELIINYRTDNVVQEIRRFAPEGVNIYWDTSGNPDLGNALPLMARRGRIIIMSGLNEQCRLSLAELYTRNCTIYGFTISDLSTAELHQAAQMINHLLAAGTLKPRLYDLMPLSRASEAHSIVERGRLFGKIVLIPDSLS